MHNAFAFFTATRLYHCHVMSRLTSHVLLHSQFYTFISHRLVSSTVCRCCPPLMTPAASRTRQGLALLVRQRVGRSCWLLCCCVELEFVGRMLLLERLTVTTCACYMPPFPQPPNCALQHHSNTPKQALLFSLMATALLWRRSQNRVYCSRRSSTPTSTHMTGAQRNQQFSGQPANGLLQWRALGKFQEGGGCVCVCLCVWGGMLRGGGVCVCMCV